MSIKYVLVEKHDSVIKCIDIYETYPYAVGETVLRIDSYDKIMKSDGFKLVEKNDLYELDDSTGIGWYRKYSNKYGYISKSIYYLLELNY